MTSSILATHSDFVNGLPQTVTDASGLTTSTSYNAEGQVTSVTVAKGSDSETTEFLYDEDLVSGPASGATGTPFAYRNVHANELRFDYRKVQFRFAWEDGVEPEQQYAVTYHILFIPEDDPDTSEDESIIGMELVGDPIVWDGQATTVFEIDPETLKPGEDGRFELVSLEIGRAHV